MQHLSVKVVGSVVTAHGPLGIQKPGVLHVLEGSLTFDEFVIGVTPGSTDPIGEAFGYLLNWAQCKVTPVEED